MRLLLPLIGLFLWVCLMYGIYAGVAAILRRAGKGSGPGMPPGDGAMQPVCHALAADVSAPSRVTDLETVHALHQRGVLTDDEFCHLKQRLLAEAGEWRG